MNNLKNLLESCSIYQSISTHFKFEEDLSQYTSFKIGGKAEVLYSPHSVEELQDVLNLLIEKNVAFSVIGNASNLLISDAGLRGVTISFSKLNGISIVESKENDIYVKVMAGTLIDELTNFCIDQSLCGMENFAGLPASVGGAIFMNAKCFNSSISDLLFLVEYMDITKNGAIFGRYQMNEREWSYKHSPFQGGECTIRATFGRKLILSCLLRLKKGEKEEIEIKTKERSRERVEKRQFEFPSAGSVFKNDYNIGIPTGKLVSDAGLLGFAKNGAQIAPWHGNFIINRDHAKAIDVLYIMQMIKDEIKKKYGVVLESEVIYCE